MTRRDVELGSLTFPVDLDGDEDRPLVVLLHGFPQTGRSWRGVSPAIVDAGWRTAAPDQRGYAPGARPTDVREYTVAKLTADVLGLASAVGAELFDVVGHDWGCAVAWSLAINHPDRVRTLTAVSGPHPAAFALSIADGEQKEKSAYMDFLRAPAAESFFLENGAAVLKGLYEASGIADEAESYVQHFASDTGALTGGLNWYRANRIEEMGDWRACTVPTLHVWSTEDTAIGREVTNRTAAHVVAPYRLEVLEGIGHFIPEQSSERLASLIIEHLRANS